MEGGNAGVQALQDCEAEIEYREGLNMVQSDRIAELEEENKERGERNGELMEELERSRG